MEDIYHNECACLFAENVLDDECKKRYYEVYDLENDCHKRIFICNDYLRLCIAKKMLEYRDIRDRYRVDKRYVAKEITEDIIKKYINISSSPMSRGNDLIDKHIFVHICIRYFAQRQSV